MGKSASTRTPTLSNLAKIFTPTTPMCPGGEDAYRLTVLMDIPEKLAQQLREGLKPIDVNCLRENAELIIIVRSFQMLQSCAFVLRVCQLAQRALTTHLVHMQQNK